MAMPRQGRPHLVTFLVTDVRVRIRAKAAWVVGVEALKNMSEISFFALTMFLSLLPIFIPFILFVRMRSRGELNWGDIGFKRGQMLGDIAWGGMGYLASLPVAIIVALISARLFQRFETPLNPAVTEVLGSTSIALLLMVFFEAAIMAPIVEETMFRGIFLNSLAPRMGRMASSMTSAGVFAILHPQLPVGFLSLFTLGIIFNSLFRIRGSILPGMVAHAINNGAIVIFMSLALSD